MALHLEKAVKAQSKLRLALAGPAGAGKTYTSLLLADIFAEGGMIVVIDTEHGRASKYAGEFNFHTIKLDTFAPTFYMEALGIAYTAGAKVVIIDSLSHAWNGEGGVLEVVDDAARKSAKNDKFNSGWSVGTPLQNKLMNTIQRAPFHIITTMRSHVEYAQERGPDGRTKIIKLGTKPIQREGVDYEFDVYGMMDRDHNLTIEKSICHEIAVGEVIAQPGPEFGQIIFAWLNDGKAIEEGKPL